MKRPVQLTVTIMHSGILDADDRREISARFVSAVDHIASALAAGSEQVPVSFLIGKAEKTEPYCRTCRKKASELPAGVVLEIFDSTRGVRPSMEAALNDGPVSYYCGCVERLLSREQQ